MADLNVFEIRKRSGKIGKTQNTFAKALGVPLKTVQNWEQGRRKPTGPARSLLVVIQHQPNALADAMQALSAA
jgi:DNA-binding transcriptional regulator YiaG